MMTHAQLATASLDDIVFDGRNKTYGAYELRRIYERHVRRAVIIATALLALLLAFPIIANLMKEPYVYTPPKTDGHKPLDVVIPLPPVTPPPVQPAVSAATTESKPATKPTNTVKFTANINVTENAITDIPDVETLVEKDPGTVTVEGPKAPKNLEVELPVGKPGGNGGVAGGTGLPSNVPYTYVEQMPELPGGGGAAAIAAAIQRAVNYPALAVRNGVEGRLVASFVVNEKGDITDIKIVKGLGSGLDEETIRAIKTLPRFIPGRQNGRAVSVSYTVPLNFNIR